MVCYRHGMDKRQADDVKIVLRRMPRNLSPECNYRRAIYAWIEGTTYRSMVIEFDVIAKVWVVRGRRWGKYQRARVLGNGTTSFRALRAAGLR